MASRHQPPVTITNELVAIRLMMGVRGSRAYPAINPIVPAMIMYFSFWALGRLLGLNRSMTLILEREGPALIRIKTQLPVYRFEPPQPSSMSGQSGVSPTSWLLGRMTCDETGPDAILMEPGEIIQ